MTPLYPLRFAPIYKEYIWGGHRFVSSLGRELDPERTYAESWEICDHPQGQSIVEHGPLADTSLQRLVVGRGEELLGRHHPKSRFPLLLKYLDADQRLSLQVHPDDELAAGMGLSDPGKTEAWFVVEAKPGSVIWTGFNRPVDRRTVREAIEQGGLESWLDRFEPAEGDCLFLPAGTAHALGEGLLVVEIQQTSDNTFRLFDWNRTGPDGKPRQLHVEEGLEAIDYRRQSVRPQTPQATDRSHVERLVACEKFILDRGELASGQPFGGDARCHIITVIRGSVTVQGDPAERPLERGRTVLLPAAIGPVEFTPGRAGPVELLDAYLP